uniref:Uncharacterized protein n=1 Tax=Acrobeloides nanus TaxID=290746 RepID=A0A914CKB7_9BILA
MVPFFICVVPLGLVLILCALQVRTAGKALLLPIILAWIPVLNPFAAIILVKEYRTFFTRRTAFQKFKAWVLRRDFNEMNIYATSISKVSSIVRRTAGSPSRIEPAQAFGEIQ